VCHYYDYHGEYGDGKEDGDNATAENGADAGALVELLHQMPERLQHKVLLGEENEHKDGEEEQCDGRKGDPSEE